MMSNVSPRLVDKFCKLSKTRCCAVHREKEASLTSITRLTCSYFTHPMIGHRHYEVLNLVGIILRTKKPKQILLSQSLCVEEKKSVYFKTKVNGLCDDIFYNYFSWSQDWIHPVLLSSCLSHAHLNMCMLLV